MPVTFENTRFDPDLIEFHGIAKQMAASVGYTADLSVDGRLAQLLRLRVAQMNPCSYCLILHTKAAHDQGIAVEKVAHLASWRESTMFTRQNAARWLIARRSRPMIRRPLQRGMKA